MVKRNRFNRESGFTLIELMIAVVIVAVLATVAVVSMKKYSQRARTQEAINFLLGVKTKQATYFLTYQHYASTNNYYPGNAPSPPAWEAQGWDISCPGGSENEKAWCALGASRPDSLGACSGGIESESGRCSHHQFLVMGWKPGGAAPDPTYINEPNRQWWYAIGKGDLDQDGNSSEWFLSSETLEVYNKAGDEI